MTKKINELFNWRVIKHSLTVMLLSMIFVFIPVASTGLAQSATGGNWWTTAQQGGLDQVGRAYGGGEPRNIRMIVVDIIKIILGFLGILAVVLILYAGFKWLTAGGNEEKVGEAKKILIAGIIGLTVILSAYILANFVINQIYGATTGTQFINYY